MDAYILRETRSGEEGSGEEGRGENEQSRDTSWHGQTRSRHLPSDQASLQWSVM